AGCGAARTGLERSPEPCSCFNSEKQDEKRSVVPLRQTLPFRNERRLNGARNTPPSELGPIVSTASLHEDAVEAGS
ncbi:hypothetical protein ACFWGT_14020, partial [Nocardiopsis sp. NPDC060348]|uniref:hypothetical protein n=1 Tax=Nocardiopsis sp. NPDC060348 TaxID=3347102 RepID=UPI003662A24E